MKKIPAIKSPHRLVANDSYTFLISELEKVDEKILEPLSSTDWPRDMPVITGGGMIDNIAAISVSYGSSGGEEDNLIFDNANDIPVVQADMSKAIARTFNFAEYMAFSVIEKEKMAHVARNPQEFLDKGIRLHLDKTVDRNVYTGFTKTGSIGLINNPNVTRYFVSPATPGGVDTAWAGKTADQILKDINELISAIWEDNDCSPDGLPNHILLPVAQFAMLVHNKVSSDSERSILTYVLENNLVRQQGQELIISPCKWCHGIGSGGRDRMVAYRNNIEDICFNLTQPLMRLETEYADMRIKIPYIAQFSEVRFLYPTTVQYRDGL